MRTTLGHLRRYTVAGSLFPPTTLRRAIERMGFVQADTAGVEEDFDIPSADPTVEGQLG